METIEKRNGINKIKMINSVCLMKKLFIDIPKIKTKLIIAKLKNIKVNKSKYEKLKNGINEEKLIYTINTNFECWIIFINYMFIINKIILSIY